MAPYGTFNGNLQYPPPTLKNNNMELKSDLEVHDFKWLIRYFSGNKSGYICGFMSVIY